MEEQKLEYYISLNNELKVEGFSSVTDYSKNREKELQRSAIMAKVKSKDTTPEMIVRRMLYRAGYRYRLHKKDLPGKPDIVFSGRKKIIFVHGCFWHGHDCRAGRNQPSTNKGYWETKFRKNQERDKKNIAELKEQGWEILIVWECELKKPDIVLRKIISFLG